MKFISLRVSSLLALLLVLIPVYMVTNHFISSQLDRQLNNAKQKVRQVTNNAFDTMLEQAFVDIEILAEEIVFFHRLDDQDENSLLKSIEKALPRLQINHPIRAAHLISADGARDTLGDFHSQELGNMYSRLIKTQVPVHSIECQAECLLNVMVPIKVGEISWGLMLSSELTDLFITFNRSNRIDVGLIMPLSSEPATGRSWKNRSIPIITNNEKMMSVLEASSDTENILQYPGATIRKGGEVYYVWSHHYRLGSSHPLQTIFFYDQTDVTLSNASRLTDSITLMLVILSGLFVTVLIFSSFPIRRLIRLTASIKHLGSKNYEQAIASLEETKQPLIADEISMVQNSINTSVRNLQNFETQLLQSQQHLEYVATHDSVTNCLNRYAFSVRFEELCRSELYGSVALLLVDIDDFNAMNDNLGHQTGDKVLNGVGERLSLLSGSSVEIYRYGGDEFMLLCLDETGSTQQVESLIVQLEVLFEEPVDIESLRLPINLSCGIAQSLNDENPLERLPAQVTLALLEAKKNSTDSYAWFTLTMETQANLRYRIKTDFEKSLLTNEFSIHYQPMITFSNAKLVKMEALVRWQHKELGQIYPDQFIPVLEETGQIEQLTFWLVEETINQFRMLDELGLNEVKISVNVSGQQVSDNQFISRLITILQQHQISPELLELEITETSLVKDFKQAKQWVKQAKAAGFEVAMDDFGTGYSSLSYLTSINFDTVKLDRSLITDVVSDIVQQNVVKSMANMMAQLGLKIVIEGIEEYNQLTFLRNLQCDIAQGYLIAKPLSKKALLNVLDNYQPEHGWFTELTDDN